MLIIRFCGQDTLIKTFDYSVEDDNQSDVVKFILSNNQDNLILSNCSAYLKITNASSSMVDKIPLSAKVILDRVEYEWVLERKHTKWKQIKAQLQFEAKNQDVVWQTCRFVFNIRKTINADEEIENDNPTILQDFQRRITNLEERTLNDKIITKENKEEFPVVGVVDTIYIDKEDSSIYRWDNECICYVCIGNNFTNIQYIIGGELDN